MTRGRGRGVQPGCGPVAIRPGTAPRSYPAARPGGVRTDRHSRFQGGQDAGWRSSRPTQRGGAGVLVRMASRHGPRAERAAVSPGTPVRNWNRSRLSARPSGAVSRSPRTSARAARAGHAPREKREYRFVLGGRIIRVMCGRARADECPGPARTRPFSLGGPARCCAQR